MLSYENIFLWNLHTAKYTFVFLPRECRKSDNTVKAMYSLLLTYSTKRNFTFSHAHSYNLTVDPGSPRLESSTLNLRFLPQLLNATYSVYSTMQTSHKYVSHYTHIEQCSEWEQQTNIDARCNIKYRTSFWLVCHFFCTTTWKYVFIDMVKNKNGIFSTWMLLYLRKGWSQQAVTC